MFDDNIDEEYDYIKVPEKEEKPSNDDKNLTDNFNRVVSKWRLSDVNEDEFPLRAYYIDDDNRRRYCGFKSVYEFTFTMKESGNNQWHEIVRNKGSGFQKFFVDVDCDAAEIEQESFTFDQYISCVINEVKSLFMVCKVSADVRVIECVSDRKDKYSRHIICRNVILRGEHAKYFGIMLQKSVSYTIDHEYGGNSSNIAKWIDVSVYDKHHSLRTHLSAKNNAPVFSIINGDNSEFDPSTLVTVCEPDSIILECPDWMCIRRGSTLNNHQYSLPYGDIALNRLKPLLLNLNPVRFSDYDSWCKMGMALYNASNGSKDGLKLWDECSAKKNPEKYKPGECEFKYSTFKLPINGQTAITAATIFRWAKMDCEAKLLEYKRAQITISIGMSKTKTSKFDNYNSQIKNSKNIASLVLDKPMADKETFDVYIKADLEGQPRMAVKSALNTGKSKLIITYIAEQIAKNPNFKCVLLQFRTSLSDDVALKTQNMGFTDYRTVGGAFDLNTWNRVFIQVESLHRFIYTDIDLLVIDEVESVDAQLFAGLNSKHDTAIQSMFQNILNDSKQIILLDGLLSNKTVKAYESYLGEKFFVHVNTPPKEKKKLQIMVSECQWKNDIVANLCLGRKLYVVSPKGKNFIEKFLEYVVSECKSKGVNINALSIYGGKDNSQITKNFNVELVKYDLVVASPAVSAGVDFNIEGYFYKVYSFVSSRKVGAVSQLQSLKRVRKPICKDITMLVQHCSREPLPLTPEDIIFSAENKMWHNSVEGIKWPIGTKMIYDRRGNMKFEDTDNKWFKFFLRVQSVINIQKFDVLAFMINWLEEDGYECELVEDVTNKIDVKFAQDIGKLIKSKNIKEIAEAKDISQTQAAIYMLNKRHTAKEAAELSKYNLRDIYGWGGVVDEGFVAKYKPESIIRMFITMRDKNTPLEILANEAEARIIGKTDIEKVRITEHVDKHKAIRELLEFLDGLKNLDGVIVHNSKLGGGLDKIQDYINKAVTARHPSYKDKKLQTNVDRVCQIVNDFINDYGVKLERTSRSGKGSDVKNYEIVNMFDQYFTTDENDKTMPYIRL